MSLITIIGRGHGGTRAISHTLIASNVFMGEPLNRSGDLLPPQPMYEACRVLARYVEWKGGLEWDFSALHTMPIPEEFTALIHQYLQKVLSAKEEHKGWKIPETTLVFPWIVRMFPEIKYIYWVRNPRDNILARHLTDNLADFGVPQPDAEQLLRERYPNLLARAETPEQKEELVWRMRRALSMALDRDGLIEAFGQAARRAKEAGFDGVLIHGAHGYLVNLFISPFTNRRADEWGGDSSRRFRFLQEVYRAIRKAVGNTYPVAIKLGLKDDVEDGLSLEEGVEAACRLAKLGMDAIEVSGGLPTKTAGASRSNIQSRDREAYFLPYAKALRPKVGPLPLSLVGGLRSPDLMEEIIGQGWVDFVSLARPFICEPDLVTRIRAGRREPLSCLRCDRCRTGFAREGLRCRREEPPSGES